MKSFYIKARHNPQLRTYYVLLGQITKKEAKSFEKSLYGSNQILEFKTEQEYLTEIERLKSQGSRVR